MGLNASKILEIVDNPSILDRIKVDNFTLIQAKINNMLISSLETNGLSEDDLLIFLDFSYNQLLNISEDIDFINRVEFVVDRSFYKFLKLFELDPDHLKNLIYFDAELFFGLNFIEFDKLLKFNDRDINYNTSTLSILSLAKLEGLEFFNAIFFLAEYIFDSMYLQIASDLYKKSNQCTNLYKLKNLFTQFEKIRLSSEAAFLIRALIVDLNFRDAFLTTFRILDQRICITNLRLLLLIQKSEGLQGFFSHFVFLSSKFPPFVIEKLIEVRPRLSEKKYSNLLSALRDDNFASIFNLIKLFFL